MLQRVTRSPYKIIWMPVAMQRNAQIDSESIRVSQRASKSDFRLRVTQPCVYETQFEKTDLMATICAN